MSKRTHRSAPQPAQDDRQAWFATKRFGMGSGLPVRWQGWLTYGLYLVAVRAAVWLWRQPNPSLHASGLVLGVAATLILFIVCARHTRGGWKWRWGKLD